MLLRCDLWVHESYPANEIHAKRIQMALATDGQYVNASNRGSLVLLIAHSFCRNRKYSYLTGRDRIPEEAMSLLQ